MLSGRLCQVALAVPFTKAYPALKIAAPLRTVNLVKLGPLIRNNGIREFTDSSRTRWSHAARRKMTLKEQAFVPGGETAFSLGKGAVAGGSILGLGALCYYGLGLSSEPGALEKSLLWPQYVKDRIKTTYLYLGGSFAITLASTVSVFSSPRLLELTTRGGPLSMVTALVVMIGSGLLVLNIPYSPGFGAKQLAWAGHSALMGAFLAPMAFLGGPVLLRAVWYTAGVVGGLSAIAVCAPSEKFLQLGGPLAIGLGAVFVSSLGSMFFPPTTALGSGLHAMVLYGGLLVFSGSLLFNTQKIIHNAENHPPEYKGSKPFDPINMSFSVYLDVLNIFIRIATILSMGGSNRKR